MKDNDGLIFVVDSTDAERMNEVRDDLWHLLEQEELRDTKVLVFANKQDLPNAANPSQITDRLELRKLIDRPWYVQAACAKSGDGLVEGLTWLAEKVKEGKRRR